MFRSVWKLSFTFTDVQNVNRFGILQSEVFSSNFTCKAWIRAGRGSSPYKDEGETYSVSGSRLQM
jgi:hypothetical protein